MALPTRLQAGKLRHRLQLVKPYGAAQDSTGGLSLSNTSPVVTLWGSVEAITASDNLADQSFMSKSTHRVVIRYRGPRQAVPITIAANDQVYFGKRVFQVLGILNPDERTKLLVILCVEINDASQQTTGTQTGLL